MNHPRRVTRPWGTGATRGAIVTIDTADPEGPSSKVARRVREIPARPRFRPRGRPRRYRASSSSPRGRGDSSGRPHKTIYRSATTWWSRTWFHGTAGCATAPR